MRKISWDLAPDWAKGYGLTMTNHGIEEVWFGDDQYYPVHGDGKYGPYPYGGGIGPNMHNLSKSAILFREDRPVTWNGEGLPPVGTICEVDDVCGWIECEVIAHYKNITGDCAAFTVSCSRSGYKRLGSYKAGFFRPIKTAEQIAAEEREKAIKEIAEILGGLWSSEVEAAGFLYDAGYRKVNGDA